MANTNRIEEAAEKLARATRDSYQTVLDQVVGVQERNVRFAQGVVESSIRELRRQAESNQAITRELAERAEDQREAFQALAEESLNAYMDLLYAPLSYYKQGLEAVGKVAK